MLRMLHASVGGEETKENKHNEMFALRSAINYATVTSLTPAECLHHLGQERAALLEWLRSTTESALNRADMIVSSEMSTLQALVFYLVSFLPRFKAAFNANTISVCSSE